jgi:hypothetical protein
MPQRGGFNHWVAYLKRHPVRQRIYPFWGKLNPIRKGTFLVHENSLPYFQGRHLVPNSSNDPCAFEAQEVLIFGDNTHRHCNVLAKYKFLIM